jgi:hypothetical protein
MQNLQYNTRYSRRSLVGVQNPQPPVAGDGNCYTRVNGRITGVQQISQPNFWERLGEDQIQLPQIQQNYVSGGHINLIDSTDMNRIINEQDAKTTYDQNFTENIPEEFLCPITMDIMNDPVICEYGYSYERTAIMAIKDSKSPMTRQIINKNNLIPNRALKQSIDKFKDQHEKPLTPEQIEAKRLADLQREKINKMKQFQQEQIEKQRVENEKRMEAIRREREEKAKREAELKALEEKKKKEEDELRFILMMINDKMPVVFKTGYRQMSWTGNGLESFHESTHKIGVRLESVINLKNKNIDAVRKAYGKIKSDIEWINKYVIGTEGFDPFVDYAFDNFIDKIDELISKKEADLINGDKFNNWNRSNYNGYNVDTRRDCESELNYYRQIKKKYTQSREYYHVNGMVENSIGIPINKIILNTWQHLMNDQLYQRYSFKCKYIADQVKIIDAFLIDFCKIADCHTGHGPDTFGLVAIEKFGQNGSYRDKLNIFYGHKEYIKYKHQNHQDSTSYLNMYNTLFEKSDYNELLQLGNAIIELIELVRPEVQL